MSFISVMGRVTNLFFFHGYLIVLFFSYTSNSYSCDGFLNCWLDGLIITIPDTCFNEEIVNCCSKDMTCLHTTFSNIDSQFQDPTSVEFQLRGMKTTCKGRWKCGLFSGRVTANIKNIDLQSRIDVIEADILPSKISSNNCHTSNLDIDLDFSGSIAADILDAFSKNIDAYLQKELSSKLCDKLGDELANNGTSFLTNQLDPALERLMQSSPSAVRQRGDCLDWDETILGTWNRLAPSWLPTGSLKAFLAYATNNTGVYTINLNDHTFSWPITSPTIVSTTTTTKAIASLLQDDIKDIVELATVNITIHDMRVSGLLDMYDMSPLSPVSQSNVSLSTSLKAHQLGVSVTLSVVVVPAQTLVAGSVLVEKSNVEVQMENVSIGVEIVAAAIANKFNALYMDQILQSDGACLLSVMDEVSISSLDFNASIVTMGITPAEIAVPVGSQEVDLDKLINSTLLIATKGFSELLTKTFNGIVQGPVRAGINAELTKLLSMAPRCPEHVIHDKTNWISWNGIDIGKGRILGPTVVPELLNVVIDMKTDSGAVKFHSKTGWDVLLSGLDSIYKLDIRSKGNKMNNPFQISADVALGNRPLPSQGNVDNNLGSDHSIELLADGDVNNQPLTLHAAIARFTLSLLWDIRVNADAVLNLQMPQAQQLACWASTVDVFKILKSDPSVVGVDLVVDGIDLGGASDRIINGLLDQSSGPLMLSLINSQIQAVFSELGSKCLTGQSGGGGGSSAHNEPSKHEWWSGNGVVASSSGIFLSGFIVMVVGLAVWILKQRHKGGSYDVDDALVQLSESLDDKKKYNSESNNVSSASQEGSSMRYTHHRQYHHGPHAISSFTPVLLSVLILGNMALFLWSNLSIGANVNLLIAAGSEHISPNQPVFQFSLGDTVHDMWQAGVYPLAILIAFFSGAWPYIKLTGMLLACTLPVRYWSMERRESILVWLDCLGKWSLVDVFVLVLLMSAFHMKVPVSDNLDIFVHVEPDIGFYTFLTATISSLCLSHVVLALVRHGQTVPDLMNKTFVLKPESVLKNRFRSVRSGNTLLAMVYRMGFYVVSALLLLMPVLLGLAVSLHTFRFQFSGLVGWLLGPDRDSQSYSLWTVGVSLPESSGHPEQAGVWVIEVAFLLFGAIMPLLSCVTLLVLWFVPLSLVAQKRVLTAAEVANDWSALDVFVVSITASLMQIERFAIFIVGSSCRNINYVLRTVPSISAELHGENRCFDVEASLTQDSWVLFVAAVMFAILSPLVLRLANRAITLDRSHIYKKDNYDNVVMTDRDEETEGGGGDTSRYVLVEAEEEADCEGTGYGSTFPYPPSASGETFAMPVHMSSTTSDVIQQDDPVSYPKVQGLSVPLHRPSLSMGCENNNINKNDVSSVK